MVEALKVEGVRVKVAEEAVTVARMEEVLEMEMVKVRKVGAQMVAQMEAQMVVVERVEEAMAMVTMERVAALMAAVPRGVAQMVEVPRVVAEMVTAGPEVVSWEVGKAAQMAAQETVAEAMVMAVAPWAVAKKVTVE